MAPPLAPPVEVKPAVVSDGSAGTAMSVAAAASFAPMITFTADTASAGGMQIVSLHVTHVVATSSRCRPFAARPATLNGSRNLAVPL